jgi:hypothetical protein
MISADNWTIWDGGKECIHPEIELSGLGVPIIDGDTTPDIVDDTDFGIMTLGSTPITHTFTIINWGVNKLDLTGTPIITLTVGTHFSVTQQPITTTVVSGTPVTFQITFDAGSEGVFTDTVMIESNDSDESPYTFVIKGEGKEDYMLYLPVILK